MQIQIIVYVENGENYYKKKTHYKPRTITNMILAQGVLRNEIDSYVMSFTNTFQIKNEGEVLVFDTFYQALKEASSRRYAVAIIYS
jgi:hypothetical protein